MKKRSRLTGRRDFQRVVSTRRLLSTASLVGFAQPGTGASSRVGVAASKGIRGAVARNRARRRLREAVRLSLSPDGSLAGAAGINIDVVLIARPPLLSVSIGQIQADLARLVAKLAGPAAAS